MTDEELEAELAHQAVLRQSYSDTPDRDEQDTRDFEEAGDLYDEFSRELEQRKRSS
jgi:hypothetical protein